MWSLQSQMAALEQGTWPDSSVLISGINYLVVGGGGGGGYGQGGGAGAGGYRASGLVLLLYKEVQ